MSVNQRKKLNIQFSCQNEGEMKGKKSIYRPPMALAIQLQRFNQDRDQTKINKVVQFEQVMDISRTITESEKANVALKYNLYGMIVHTGQTINDGHYKAYVKSSNGIWYCMDNENVHVNGLNKLMEEKPYMLFYTLPPKVEKRENKEKVAKKTIVEEIEVEEDSVEEQVEQEEEDEEEVELAEVNDEDEEKNLEKELLEKAVQEAANKEKIENTAAIVVDHNENMKSKRDKLGALIEKESVQSKSAEVKTVLLSNIPSNQFQDNIETWDEDVGDTVEKRKTVLKQFKQKRKRVDEYDLDYDRGKMKKIKNKQDDKFNKPNLFQITAEMKAGKKNKAKGKGKGKAHLPTA